MSSAGLTPQFIAGMGEYVQFQPGIVAQADGTKANATVLNYGLNQVDSVVGSNDSVLLPPAVPRAMVILINNDASNAMQVFGQGTDTINGVATGTGVSQAAGEIAILSCVEEGAWFGGVLTAF